MPTIKDIAREAGVSHGTVSNVLNKTGKVSIEKIRLVEEAAKKLGYVPNAQAQMLRQGTPTSVAIILPSLQQGIYLDLYTALQSCLIQSGYETSIYVTNDIAENEKSVLGRLPLSHLAAIVTISCLIETEPSFYQALPCPVFFVDRMPAHPEPRQICLSFDYFSIGRDLGTYIRENSWKNIAFFSSAHNYSYIKQLQQGIHAVLNQTDTTSLSCFTSDINLATAKAFEIAQTVPAFDCVITSDSLRADAVNFALQISKVSQTPSIVTLGPTASFRHAAYELDYSQIGIKISESITADLQKGFSLPSQIELPAKGFPYRFPQIKRQSPCELTMLALNAPSTEALKKLTPLLEDATGIRLKISSMSYDDLHAQIGVLNKHFYFDLIRMDVAHLDSLGLNTYLPLEEAGISPEMLPEKLISSAYDKYSMINGKRYTLPFDPSVQIFLYRSDLFNDAKLSRSYYERYHENLAVPQTIEQYMHMAEFFTAACNPESPTKYGTTFTVGSSYFASCDFLPYYLAQNSELFNSDKAAQLNTPEMISAMRQYLKMSQFSTQQDCWSDSVRQFAEGNVATTAVFSNHSASIINTKHSSVVGKIGAAILPGGHPLLGGGVIGISKYSANVEACIQFFNWYYALDVASLLVRLGGTSPLLDIYNDFKHYNIFPWLSAAKKGFEIGTRRTGSESSSDFSLYHYEFALGTAIRNLVTGILSPEEAASTAQAIYDNSVSSQKL